MNAARLGEFVQLRGLESKPVLVLQARPAMTPKLAFELSDVRVRRTVRGGVKDTNSYWDGFFNSSGPKPTFLGLATGTDKWALEVHRDGHFLAAIWDFPTVQDGKGGSVTALPDFFGAMFSDFCDLVEAVLAEVELKAVYGLTATLVQASQLAYVTGDSSRRGGAVAAPLQDNLQWPIAWAEVGGGAWAEIPKDMADALSGIYGAQSPAGRRY
jgi:hypothetical protein